MTHVETAPDGDGVSCLVRVRVRVMSGADIRERGQFVVHLAGRWVRPMAARDGVDGERAFSLCLGNTAPHGEH